MCIMSAQYTHLHSINSQSQDTSQLHCWMSCIHKLHIQQYCVPLDIYNIILKYSEWPSWFCRPSRGTTSRPSRTPPWSKMKEVFKWSSSFNVSSEEETSEPEEYDMPTIYLLFSASHICILHSYLWQPECHMDHSSEWHMWHSHC